MAGAGLELVVLTGPEHVGEVQAAGPVPAHSFITRLAEGGDWVIASLARRLPVPGWPPAEQEIPYLEGSAPS